MRASQTQADQNARVFWALQCGGWTAYAIALMVPWLGRYSLSVMWSNKLVIAGTGLVTSSILRLIYLRIAREGTGLFTLCVVAIGAAVTGAFVWNSVASTILGRSLQNDSVLLGALGKTLPRFDGVLYHSLVLLTWSLLYLGARHYRALVAERERSLRAESLAREARLLALRYQISPHFLFNALNAISTLVVTDRKTDATNMIARLADLLRVSLEPPANGLIPLRSELEIVHAYIAIERVRFADRLDIEIDADARALDARVPAMILQPLVENAVRHAVAVRDEATCVRIRVRVGSRVGVEFAATTADTSANSAPTSIPTPLVCVLSVSDDGPGLTGEDGLGVGLANIRGRLEELYGHAHQFTAGPTPSGGFHSEITLPFECERSTMAPRVVLEAQPA